MEYLGMSYVAVTTIANLYDFRPRLPPRPHTHHVSLVPIPLLCSSLCHPLVRFIICCYILLFCYIFCHPHSLPLLPPFAILCSLVHLFIISCPGAPPPWGPVGGFEDRPALAAVAAAAAAAVLVLLVLVLVLR